MVRLCIVSGKNAGTAMVAGRFPYRIGRSPRADLCIEDAGVWDQHLELDLNSRGGFLLSLQGNALATINGEPFRQVCLKNGDLIEIGSLKMQFTLSETTQRAFRLREALTWTGLAVLFAIQIGLIYWLIE
jgi:pSer/pThr/pTyr-binding forkhead associated (FHA) protein